MTDLMTQLHDVLGDKGLITGDDVKTRPADWLGLSKCQAKAIIRPANSQELSAVMKLCHKANQPVIASGGLTGLVHGTDSHNDEIIISTERMRAIEAIDPVARTMTVQAGVPMQAAQEAADKEGLLFAVDLGARGSATIGGNIATNAGGNQVIRYGMTRANILGLEAVLADGTIVSSMNRLLKNNTGYDLKQLFIGAEGTLGIVTRAVLRLHPKPKSENTALLAFEDFGALKAFFTQAVSQFGGQLSAFEVMWANHYTPIAIDSGRHQAPLPGDYAYYAIIQTHGLAPEQDAEHFETVLGEAMEAGHIVDAVIANSQSQSQAIWDIREDIEGIMHAIMPAAIFDVSLPISEMEDYIARLEEAVKTEWNGEGKLMVFGHLGDGNLHIGVAPRPFSEDARHKAETLVYTPLAAINGSVSAEHGIGLEKKPWLHLSRSEAELSVMKTIKSALDPKGILNPGKIF